MARGEVSEVGVERKAPNGYWYVKVEGRGWVLKHWLIWEAANGRQIDSDVETARFKDGNRTNFDLDNINVIPKGTTSLRGKLARLYSQRAEVEAQIKYYEGKLQEAQSTAAKD